MLCYEGGGFGIHKSVARAFASKAKATPTIAIHKKTEAERSLRSTWLRRKRHLPSKAKLKLRKTEEKVKARFWYLRVASVSPEIFENDVLCTIYVYETYSNMLQVILKY